MQEEPEMTKPEAETKKEPELTRMAMLDVSKIKEQDPELAEEVFLIYREMQTLRSQLGEAKESERSAWAEVVSYKTDNQGLTAEIEKMHTFISRMQSAYDAKVRETNNLRIEHEDLSLRQAITETSFKILLETLENMHARVAEKYVESIPDAIRREMEESLSFMMEQVNKVLEAAPAKEVPILEAGK